MTRGRAGAEGAWGAGWQQAGRARGRAAPVRGGRGPGRPARLRRRIRIRNTAVFTTRYLYNIFVDAAHKRDMGRGSIIDPSSAQAHAPG